MDSLDKILLAATGLSCLIAITKIMLASIAAKQITPHYVEVEVQPKSVKRRTIKMNS